MTADDKVAAGPSRLEAAPLRWAVALAAALLAGCGGGGGGGADTPPAPTPTDITDGAALAAGGATTVARADVDAFGQPAANLDFIGDSLFEAGNHIFRTPRSGFKGTGPLFNAQSCQGCHVLDGRGSPPRDTLNPGNYAGPLVSMLLRLNAQDVANPLAGYDSTSGVVPDPVYGGQLQTRSAWGDGVDADGLARFEASLTGGPALGEAQVHVRYESIQGSYPDGTPYTLLKPVLRVSAPSYGSFSAAIRFSPRVAPPIFGNGLLGAISDADIVAREDENDRDGDGVSGRANRVWSAQAGSTAVGRFGLKAGKATVLDQTAGAFRGDMGLTSSLAPGESCTAAQAACVTAAGNEQAAYREPNGTDLTDLELAQVEFYTRTLAVPRPRGWDSATSAWQADVGAGRRLFDSLKCVACHVPSHTTGSAAGSALGDIKNLTELSKPAAELAQLSRQKIWPYTDLLLHDMGGSCTVTRETDAGAACTGGAECRWVQRCDGLADGTAEFLANGREWRTPPLWGLGLTKTVNPQAGYLHDGRARTIEEAVLWHGQAANSEARGAWERFVALSATARAQLLAFLGSL